MKALVLKEGTLKIVFN